MYPEKSVSEIICHSIQVINVRILKGCIDLETKNMYLSLFCLQSSRQAHLNKRLCGIFAWSSKTVKHTAELKYVKFS